MCILHRWLIKDSTKKIRLSAWQAILASLGLKSSSLFTFKLSKIFNIKQLFTLIINMTLQLIKRICIQYYFRSQNTNNYNIKQTQVTEQRLVPFFLKKKNPKQTTYNSLHPVNCASTDPHQVTWLLDETIHWHVVFIQVLQHRPPRTSQIVNTIPRHK